MGQGRRKSQRDYSYRQRKRSITSEVENQESMELMHFLGPAAIVRSRLETKSIEKLRKREPTPFPKTKIDTQTIPISNPLDLASKTREATMDSPRNVFLDNPVLHSTVDYPSPVRKQTVDSISSYLVYTFFNNSWILQNECRRELTEENKKSIEGIFDSLLSIARQEQQVTYIMESTQLLHSLFYTKRDIIVRFLVDGCRFERIYGLSTHTAVLDLLLSSFADLHSFVVQALYETVLDYYETERMSGGNQPVYEDSFYVQETEYGQIHRVIEIWSSSINRIYAQFYTCLFNRESCDPSILNESDILLRTGLLLLQLSSVVRKYRKTLVLPFVQLFSLSEKNVYVFLTSIACKLPVSCPKKLIAWLELLCDIMDQCPALLNGMHKKEITILLGKIVKLAAGSHIDCCIQALTLLSNKRLLVNHILLNGDCMKMLDNCIHATQSHWHQVVRDKGEELFDLLLDLMEA